MKPSYRENLPGTALTERERQVLIAYAHRPLYKAVGTQLGITEDTVREHLWSVHVKLGVPTTVDAFRVMGWLRPPRLA